MLNLAVNLALIIIGLFFIATSIWGKRFYQANWRNPLWGRITTTAIGVLLLIWGVLSLVHKK
ncbi:MAG: hypothetical protein ABSF23_11390 [Terracidiphilus sp.]|jgi:threonine/homoserine/homoserine lactone efflux protein